MTEAPVQLFRRSFEEKLAAAGLVCSTALGVGLNVLDWAGPGEATLVALAGATLTFVVGAGLRAERRFLLSDLVDAAPALRAQIDRCLTLTALIARGRPDAILDAELRRRYGQFAADLERLSRGQVVCEGADGTRIVERTDGCTTRMRAVTYVAGSGPGWWLDPVGRDYWRANVRAMRERNVTITRVFIAADPHEPRLAALMAAQRAAEVDTRLLHPADVRRDQLVNLVIWDDRLAWEGEMAPDGGVRRNVFHHGAEDVRRLSAIADELIARAAA